MTEQQSLPDHPYEPAPAYGPCWHEVLRLETGEVVRCERRLLEHEPWVHREGEIQPGEAKDPS